MDQMAEHSIRDDGRLRRVGLNPLWQQCAAILGLAGIPVGLGAAILSPGPLAGAIFPVSLFIVWVVGLSRRGPG